MIADIRKEYKLKTLNETGAETNAITQFDKWWQEALNSNIDEVNAMTVATATTDGKPSARIVLLKGFDENGFVFFTNYNSHKGKELALNPNACVVFYWKELERQVRIEGAIEKTSSNESDTYFLSRPAGSQIGAWSSPQSSVIADRGVIEESEKMYTGQFENEPMKRPQHWGGYRLKPQLIEFWQGRPSRLHDRLQYTLQANNSWKIERLAP
ncbi:MAG: pyridoxamine 5'-phosphate oxidase [Ferruginibacter sp.]|nr:pyridoxamine 5'-phosphate oxidase [Ferruginibacter sp.]